MTDEVLRGPDTLSKSSVSTYLRCGQQWFFSYVMRIERPPSVRQAIGIAGHSAVAANYSQKVVTHQDVPGDVMPDVFSDEWDEMGEIVPDGEESTKQGKDSGIKAVRKYASLVAPGVQPALVEHPVMFDVDGIPYSGWIDVADDVGRIRDTKFVARTPSALLPDQALAMTGYALGYRHLTGEKESEVQLDHIVRLKRGPTYAPIPSGGPISDAMISRFARTIRSVADSIKKGVFLPNGLQSNACSWCSYTDICPAYKEFKR